MENNDKFRILSTDNNSFKKIDEKEDIKDNKNDKNKNNNDKVKLPEWSIEPPLEIKRGK